MGNTYYEQKQHIYMHYADNRFADYIFNQIRKELGVLTPSAIEFGAGMGRFSFPIVKNFVSAVLVEPSETFHDALVKSIKMENVVMFCQTIEKFVEWYQVKEKTTIFAYHVMHHLDNKQRSLLFKFVKKSGCKCVLVEPNPYNPLIMLQILIERDMKLKNEWQYAMLTKSKYAHELEMQDLKLTTHKYFCPIPPIMVNQLLRHIKMDTLGKLEMLANLIPPVASYQMLIAQ